MQTKSDQPIQARAALPEQAAAVFIVDDIPRSTIEMIYKADLRKRLPVAG